MSLAFSRSSLASSVASTRKRVGKKMRAVVTMSERVARDDAVRARHHHVALVKRLRDAAAKESELRARLAEKPDARV